MSGLLFVIFASLVITVTVSVPLMCPESVPTVSFVSRCPSNAKEWKSASFRKRCNDVGKIQKCTKAENFVYHCILNEEATALLEVCAPLYFMSGYCARYSIEEQKIINDPRLDCTQFDLPCPTRFQSNESYKYETTTTTIVNVSLVILVIITLSLLSLLFVGYHRNWIEFPCGKTKLNDEEDEIETTELMKDPDITSKSARDETNEDVVPEKIKETVDINEDYCKDQKVILVAEVTRNTGKRDKLTKVAEKTEQRKEEIMHDNSVADGGFHENKTRLSNADQRKSNPELTPKELLNNSAVTTMGNTFAKEHIFIKEGSTPKSSRPSEDEKSEDSKSKRKINYPENIHHRHEDINLNGKELRNYSNAQDKDSACIQEGGNVQNTSQAASKEFVTEGAKIELTLSSSTDLRKSEIDRRRRKDTNDEGKKTKFCDPKEHGDGKKELYTSSNVWLFNEPEDEGEDYVNIKKPADKVTVELHSSTCGYTNCGDSEFEKHREKEPAEFTPVKDTCNITKYTMSYDPKIQGDPKGEIHDEDLRPGNYEGIKARPAKQNQTRIQEPLSAIDFGTLDSKRKEQHTSIGSLLLMDLLMNEDKELCEIGIPADTVTEYFEHNVENDSFELFEGKDSVFSMWYPCTFIVEGKTYNCVEQYMVHQKAEIMNDTEIAEVIMALNDPREIRQSGKEVKNFNQKLWDDCCEAIVETGNIEKFSQNKGLKEKLCNTFPKLLVEANPYNTKWAIGLSKDDTGALDKLNWKGHNLLGKILTRVRDKLL